METFNTHIPLEAVLKYIKKDRDDYKAKLEKLIPYTKQLETKVKELERELEDIESQMKNLEVSRQMVLDAKNAALDNARMKEEIKAFREDAKKTAWFKQLDDDRKNLKEQNKKLKMAFNHILTKYDNK